LNLKVSKYKKIEIRKKTGIEKKRKMPELAPWAEFPFHCGPTTNRRAPRIADVWAPQTRFLHNYARPM
jgi:hypothetical protein